MKQLIYIIYQQFDVLVNNRKGEYCDQGNNRVRNRFYRYICKIKIISFKSSLGVQIFRN